MTELISSFHLDTGYTHTFSWDEPGVQQSVWQITWDTQFLLMSDMNKNLLQYGTQQTEHDTINWASEWTNWSEYVCHLII